MNNRHTYVIAEAGVNHNGNIDLALALIDAAVTAGADAVKFQTFCAEQLVSEWAPKATYQKKNTNINESQFSMLKKLELSFDDHFILKAHCEKNHIAFLSTPFDATSADFLLNQLKLTIIKIASGEITTAPLLLQIARSRADIILSTGMSSLGDIEQALSVIAFGYLQCDENPSQNSFVQAYCSSKGRELLKQKVTLLHCTSDYPADFNSVNLLTMKTLQSAFNLPVGYSDHTVGISVPLAAVACGATVIEKHFTLDRSLPGPDHKASLEPDELKNMIDAIREVEMALGSSLKIPTQKELETRVIARKSLIAIQPIQQGEKFSDNNVTVKRPGNGISPMHYWDYLGQMAMRDYKVGELINE